MLKILLGERRGFVDVVARIMVVLGGIGLLIVMLQAPVFVFMDGFRDMRVYWVGALVQFSLLLGIGIGIRRRLEWARVSLLCLLMLMLLWHVYWAVAILARWSLPMVPADFVQLDAFRMPALGVVVFWSVVYAWVGFRFLRRDVAAEFHSRDV